MAFGAQQHIGDGMGCGKCLREETDGKCCPSPIRYWKHGREGEADVLFSEVPTAPCPHWCPVHQRASNREKCTLCLDKRPASHPIDDALAPPVLDTEEDPTAAEGDGVYGDDPTPWNKSHPGTGAGHEETEQMAGKKKTKRSSPKTHAAKKPANGAPKKREKGPKDRTGLVEQEISEADMKELGKQLAHETVELEKLVDKKKHTVGVLNDEIRSKEAVVSELAEQVDTGKRWVDAQTSIPGAA